MLFKSSTAAGFLAAVCTFLPTALAVRTIIPKTSFNSQADFDTDWNYNYPWGTDQYVLKPIHSPLWWLPLHEPSDVPLDNPHKNNSENQKADPQNTSLSNGGARMSKDKVAFSNGALTLTATPASGQPDASSGGKSIPIHYLSGTIHAKEHFTVANAAGAGYDFSAEFQATTTKGTWPAFWLTAVNGWPPEIDLAEWKGSGKISFNTFNTSSQVDAHDVTYPSPGNWHSIKAQLRQHGADVQVKYFMDGTEVTTQYGKDFVGKAMYL